MRRLIALPLTALVACAQETDSPGTNPPDAAPVTVAMEETGIERFVPENPLPEIALPERIVADLRAHEEEGDHPQSIARGGEVKIVYGEALAESLPWRTVTYHADAPHTLQIHMIHHVNVSEIERTSELTSLDEVPIPIGALPEGAEFESGMMVTRENVRERTAFTTGVAITTEAGQAQTRLALGRSGEWLLLFSNRESENVRDPLTDPGALEVFWLQTEGLHLQPEAPTPIAVLVPADRERLEPPTPGATEEELAEQYDQVWIVGLTAEAN